MRYLALVVAVVGAATVARAEDAIPDIKGTWTGKGKVLVYGNNVHNPGAQTMAEPPRIRDIEMTDVVEGQDGRLAWGRSSSKVMDTKDFNITLLGPDKMEKCYVHNGMSPSKSIVATCYPMERAKK